MAETSVLSLLNLISNPLMHQLRRAAEKFLVAHASGIDGVPGNTEIIKGDLTNIQPLLSHADRSDHDPSVRDWVEKVRSLAWQVEDILEDYTYDAFAGVGGGLVRLVHGIGHIPDKWKTYCRTAQQLESLMPIVDEICNVHRLVITNELAARDTSSDSNLMRSENFVVPWEKRGQRTKELELVRRWIIEESTERPPKAGWDVRRMVIALCGEGGIGKTTLAKEIYHDSKVMKQFTCRVWITVSQTSDASMLLRSLAVHLFEQEDPGKESACDDDESMIMREIGDMLRDKRYMIVFDDVRDIDLWDQIGNVFKEEHHLGSRIIITTRDKNVASSLAREARVLPLACLPKEEAWTLFNKRLFWPDLETKCPRELEHLGRQIVSKCEGLPLVILAAANVMSTKENVELAWDRTCKTLDLKLHDSPSDNILMHSYYELPSSLKQCFLYFFLFPDDRWIERKRLVRLWVAEGFIQEQTHETMEEIAECHLQELIQRNMIQVEKLNESGRVKSCRIHDRYRSAALRISHKQKFADVLDKETEILDCDARRISLHNIVQANHEKGKDLTRLRSLLVFADFEIERPLESFLSWKFKLLRVLELRGLPITELPNWVFELYNLRYLGLRKTNVNYQVLPKEIEHLHHLQTLDIWKTEVHELPRNIVKLQSLRHLIFCGTNAGDMRYRNPFSFRGRQAPKGIWDMKNLQTLKTVEATDELVKHLHEMTQLRTLSITKVMHKHYIPLLDSISKMQHMRHLAVKAATGKVITLDALRATPPHMQKLLLKGRFLCAPRWFGDLKSLTHMYLFESSSCESPLSQLGSLPNLAVLVMDGAYSGEKLFFAPNWFPKLRKLCLEDMGVRSVVVGTGALPVLGSLCIGRCGQLKREWMGMENLTALQELCLTEPTRELVDFVQPICRRLCVKLKLLDLL